MQPPTLRTLPVTILGLTVMMLSVLLPCFAKASQPMKIKVVDPAGRPVPMAQVRVEPAGGASSFTDSRGVAAIRNPSFMDRTMRTQVSSFGDRYNAKHVDFSPGGSRTLQLRRTRPRQSSEANVAERSYRLTGAGIHRNSWILGETTPIDRPLLNASVLTQGPMASTIYRNQIFWVFGGTGVSVEGGPRKNVTAATSRLPDRGGVPPDDGVNLSYFTDASGSVRELLPSAQGDTVAVRSLMVTSTDPPQLYATFGVQAGGNSVRGVLKWQDQKKRFRVVELFPDGMRVKLCSNVTRVQTEGREWFYFPCPVPVVRVPATPAALQDASRYETFTPVREGASWDGKHTDRADGNRWAWKNETPTVDHPRERQLMRNFWFPRRAGIHHLVDFKTGKPFVARDGTVFWNDFREKWIMITGEIVRDGPPQGNVYYAEADSPIGPWVYARRIASHRNTLKPPHKGPYPLHNVQQHPTMTRKNGKIVFFSGLLRGGKTWAEPIPRYNRNHLMYRLDLTKPRLHLPTPVYMNGDFNAGTTYGTARTRSDDQQDSGTVLFYTYGPDQPGIPGDEPIFNKQIWFHSDLEPVPVWQETRRVNGGTATGLTTEKSSRVISDTPVFYAWPSDFSLNHERLTELLEYRHPDRSVLVSVPETMAKGLEKSGWHFEGSIGKVWSSPRMDPPTDASAEPAPEPAFATNPSNSSGNGGSSGGGCLVERSGIAPGGLASLRALRDRLLPMALGRWITHRYYTL